MRRLLIVVAALALLSGCARSAYYPGQGGTGTNVTLTHQNYRVVKSNAIGDSHGFSLLGVLPMWTPRYSAAMTELYQSAGVAEGKATALTNVAQEDSKLYFILFSIPTLTVRADIIEFQDESGKVQPPPSQPTPAPPVAK